MTKDLVRMKGVATLQPVHAGTASTHHGVVLEADSGQKLLLVRIDGNPFNDAKTRALVGHWVDVSGYEVNGVLRFVDAQLRD